MIKPRTFRGLFFLGNTLKSLIDMISWKNSFLCIFSSLLGIGCAVNFKHPSTRFMASETSGNMLAGDVGIHVTGGANIKLIKEPFEAAPSTNPNIDEAQDIGIQVHFGVASSGFWSENQWSCKSGREPRLPKLTLKI